MSLKNLLGGDVQMATINGEGIEPSVIVYLPPGIDPGIFQWGEIMPDSTTDNPLLDSLIQRGVIQLADSPNFGINYHDLFEKALNETGGSGRFVMSTKSGAEIQVTVDSSYVQVKPNNDSSAIQFWANMNTEGILEFGLYSRSADGTHYSDDFIAHEFYEASVTYFGQDNILGIRGSWSPSSINTKQVNEAIAKGMHLEQAVKQTWSYNQALRAGFPHVTIRYTERNAGNPYSYDKIDVLFTENPTN